MVTIEPGIYTGTIRHRRFAPTAHQFQYALFMALLDVDQIPELMTRSWLTSCNRWNLSAFYDQDHIGDPGLPLRTRLEESAAAAGCVLPEGRIFLLTHLRYAGYVFNPISIYYCLDRANCVRLVLADVRNTYGGRRPYWLTPADDADRRFRSHALKSMYVSPFMTAEANYEFLLTPPAERLITHMNVTALPDGARIFDATLELARQPWTAGTIRRALLTYPLMTARVIGAIHYEALRLRLKGLAVQPAPGGRH